MFKPTFPRKILEQCGLLIGHFFQAAAVGLKATLLSQPLDISQNGKFFNATYFSENACRTPLLYRLEKVGLKALLEARLEKVGLKT